MENKQNLELLKKTYLLLSTTLIWSGICAYLATVFNIGSLGFIGSLLVSLGLLYLTYILENKVLKLTSLFMFTGFFGLLINPTIVELLNNVPNGNILLILSLFTTACIFVCISTYTIKSKKDFNYMGYSLFILLLISLFVLIGTLIINIPILNMIVSAFIILLFSGFIMYGTSNILYNYEKDYIMATIDLYLDILNIFINILSIVIDYNK
jgi:modulator of FtsH protease